MNDMVKESKDLNDVDDLMANECVGLLDDPDPSRPLFYRGLLDDEIDLKSIIHHSKISGHYLPELEWKVFLKARRMWRQDNESDAIDYINDELMMISTSVDYSTFEDLFEYFYRGKTREGTKTGVIFAPGGSMVTEEPTWHYDTGRIAVLQGDTIRLPDWLKGFEDAGQMQGTKDHFLKPDKLIAIVRTSGPCSTNGWKKLKYIQDRFDKIKTYFGSGSHTFHY
jgi:hypothetical protein